MRVGDLVRYRMGYSYLGLVVGFDDDGDPIIEFFDQDMLSTAYYITDIEVVSESR